MLGYATSALPKSEIQRLCRWNEGSSGIAEDNRDCVCLLAMNVIKK